MNASIQIRQVHPFRQGLFLVVLLSIAASTPTIAQIVSEEDQASVNYKANCTICHGEDGMGTPLGIRLHVKNLRSKEIQEKSSVELAQTIRAGKDNMPAFGNRLDSEQIEKLILYVRSKKSQSH